MPRRSARNPASGGVKMKRTGMMALITEASCTLMPRYCKEERSDRKILFWCYGRPAGRVNSDSWVSRIVFLAMES